MIFRILFLIAAFNSIILPVRASHGQLLRLRPSIGSAQVPNDSDRLCPIVPFSGLFDTTGLHEGDVAYEFTLYDFENNPITLSKLLSEGKPVLFICGSYTCSRFRGDIPLINSIVEKYGKNLNVCIVYSYEAHPAVDTSPYQQIDQIDSLNEYEGISYRQPLFYGERRKIASDMAAAINIEAPIIFDGPCNQWNAHYGPSPTYAYLIGTDGIIKAKRAPLSAAPDIEGAVENLLNILPYNDTGIFSIQFDSDTACGNTGETLQVSGKIINQTDADVLVDINRISTLLPPDWSTSLCTDACLSTLISSTSLRVLAHSSHDIKVYFYTGKTSGIGRVSLQFSNENDRENDFARSFYAVATKSLSVADAGPDHASIAIFPSPAQDKISVSSELEFSKIRIVDIFAKTVFESTYSTSYNISFLSQGTYFLQIVSEQGKVLGVRQFIKE